MSAPLTAETKLRLLAAADATMQGIFGDTTFRWFDRQMQPNYINQGTCARIRRISTEYIYTQQGRMALTRPHFQLDILDSDPKVAADAALAVTQFLGTVNLVSDTQFDSPPTTPKSFPTFILSQRSGLEPQRQPNLPLPVESIDFRIYSAEAAP